MRKKRLQETFKELKRKGEKALITFVTAGDPDTASSKKIILALEKGGADIIELGVPFSDPMADGVTIQASYERALKKGTTLASVLKLVSDIRKQSSIPIVLFGYYNPIFAFGVKAFAGRAARAGVDGVLVVDLPPEESEELKRELDRVGIDLICLLTPTSDRGRIKLVARKGSGFLYYVSVAGVTGARKTLSTSLKAAVKKVKGVTDLPVGVGFGISTPKQARKVGRLSDGVVVGSAIINVIGSSLNNKKAIPQKVSRFVSSLKRGMTK